MSESQLFHWEVCYKTLLAFLFFFTRKTLGAYSIILVHVNS